MKRDKYPGDEQPLKEGSTDAHDQQEPNQDSPPQDIQQQSSTDRVPDHADMENLQGVAQGQIATEQNDLPTPEQIKLMASTWDSVPTQISQQPSTAQPQSTPHDEAMCWALDKMAGIPQTRDLRQRISDLWGRLDGVEEALQSRGQRDRHTTESDSVADLSSDSQAAEDMLLINDLHDLHMLSNAKILSKGGPVPAGQVSTLSLLLASTHACQ